jgi:hypothetical protein
MPRTLPALPPVTDHHRRAAFTLLSWPDCTFEQAMGNDLRHRVIEACASALRKREWQQARRAVCGATYVCSTGHTNAVASAQGQRFWAMPATDLKRAAAGDRDD